jgi:hypothetical protein
MSERRLTVKIALLILTLVSWFAPAFAQTKPAEGRAPAVDQRKPVSDISDVVRISVTPCKVVRWLPTSPESR